MNLDDETNGIGTSTESVTTDIGEEKPESHRPALTINIQSWATPIVGALMLIVGLLGGYFLRPLLPIGGANTPTPVAVAPQEVSPGSTTPVAQSTNQPQNLQELMDYLVPQIKHFKGDPNAPVTLIEFSDFQ